VDRGQKRGVNMSERPPPRGWLLLLLARLLETPPEPGTVTHVEVRHDGGCPYWRGEPCDCEPEVESPGRVGGEYGKEDPHENA
jgi:hypothetical protein